MTPEVIQAIGQWVIIPLCVAGAVTFYLWSVWR